MTKQQHWGGELLCPDIAAEATPARLPVNSIMLDCRIKHCSSNGHTTIATDTTSAAHADVNAAAIHALGLLIAHAAHLIALTSEHRHSAARSSSGTAALHTSAYTKHHVFWAIMQVLTGQHTLMHCHVSLLMEWHTTAARVMC